MNYLLNFLLKIPIIKRLIPSILKIIGPSVISRVHNFYLLLDLKSSIEREIFFKKRYENKQIFYFLSLIKNKKFKYFFDIGAYIGFYSFFFEKNTNISNIYSFEPNTITFKKLNKNILLNNSKINSFNLGCSNTDQASQLWYFNSNKMGGSSVYDKTDNEFFKYNKSDLIFENIKLISLDNSFNFKNSLIAAKIDVERHELDVLEGAKDLFLIKNKSLIQVEIFPHLVDRTIFFFQKYNFKMINKINNDYYFTNIKF